VFFKVVFMANRPEELNLKQIQLAKELGQSPVAYHYREIGN